MLKHIVLLNWKENTSQHKIDEVTEGFLKLKESISDIVSYQFGPDAGVYRGNAEYALIAEFEDEVKFKAYVKHPDHVRFMSEVSGPIIETFQSIQIQQ